MPFGLRNASQTFQRFIDRVLRGLSFVYAYVDDVLVASRDVEENLQHLTLLFDRFQQFGVTLHPAKCVLGATPLEFLGRLIDSNGIRLLPSKVAAIRDFPLPTSERQLQRFLGMVNFCRRFLPNCADTILPLASLLSGSKRTFELTPAELTSFEQVKALLAGATLLTHFHVDAPISLMVDASNVAVATVLQQSLPDSTGPLALFSKKLSKAGTRYSTFRRELLAAYLALSPGIDHTKMATEQRRVGLTCDEDVSRRRFRRPPVSEGDVRADIRSCASGLLRQRKRHCNLTVDGEKRFRSLKTDDSIVVVPADKGGATVIMDKVDYVRKANTVFNDREAYAPLAEDPTKKQAAAIKKNVDELARLELINPNDSRFMTLSDPPIAHAYGLPEGHKPDAPLTIIVPLIGSPTYSLAK
nr:unnamed protein product [Spirometra erinaceieuropaei]